MSEIRTIVDINERIARGQAVIMTAEQVVELGRDQGPEAVFKQVDVVTTATFGAMCSSGVFLNTGHSSPPIKIAEAWLNEVPVYCGLAAVDLYVGATEPSRDRGPAYGGAHVICDLVADRPVTMRAFGHKTDCYPRREVEATLRLADVNQAIMCSPRNAYQNYCAATNSGAVTLHTYMGTLLPHNKNLTYATTGEMSPLLKDPALRTIGIGSPVFLAGAIGSIAWEGTQSCRNRPGNDAGVPVGPGASLMVVGDLKQMCSKYLAAATFHNYGPTLFVGMGLAIPVVDIDMARSVCVSDDQLETVVLDYGVSSRPVVSQVTYGQLRRGEVAIGDRKPHTAPLSSRRKAREICEELAHMVASGRFPITEAGLALPVTDKLSALAEGGVHSG